MKASLTEILPLLHHRYKILSLHHLPRGTLMKLVFSMTPIGQKKFYLVRNQGMEVDYDMEPAPENVPSVNTPSADILFEGHTWG